MLEYITVEDNEISVMIVPKNYPIAWADIPAPMMTELERGKRVQEAIMGLYLKGYFVEILGRRKNPVFDSKDEKSTTKIKYRPCKTKEEAEFVMAKVKEKLKGD